MPADLVKSLLFFNHEKSLFHKNEKIGLAVSGGLDSVVLLHLFYQLKEEWNLHVVVLHFDHMLRQESRLDAEFVAEICRKNHLSLGTDQADVAAYAVEHKQSIEMAARECRYAFFQRMHNKYQLNKIATAHNANDQAETVLFHIMRGSGLDGLCGIPVQRDFFIRPLLFAQREELHDYAVAHGLRWREDHSNQDESFTRNRIRHALLPLLRDEFNPQIITALNRLSDSAQDSKNIVHHTARQAFEHCITQNAEKEFVLEIEPFLTYFKSLQRLVLQHVCTAMDRDPQDITYAKLAGIRTFLRKRQSGASFPVTKDVVLIKSSGRAVFRPSIAKDHKIKLPQHEGTFELWDDLFLEIIKHEEPLTFEKNPTTEFVDADRLGSQLVIRSMHKADYFYPVNGAGRKKLSDFFIDEKVPIYKRQSIPVLESDGTIVWVCGYRLDDRFKNTDKTTKIFKLTIGTRG